MAKLKNIKSDDFTAVFAEDWEPVVLEGEAMPDFVRSIPETTRCRIIASGQDKATQPYSSRLVPSGRLVGGIDVYRHDPRDREPLNKDWYAVVATGHPDELAVDGPYRDEEHWLREVPSRYEGAKIKPGGRGANEEVHMPPNTCHSPVVAHRCDAPSGCSSPRESQEMPQRSVPGTLQA